MGAYVARTSSLNNKHSCQLFRIAASLSSLVLLSSSVSMANLSCLVAATTSLFWSKNTMKELAHPVMGTIFLVLMVVICILWGLSLLLVILKSESAVALGLQYAIPPTNTIFKPLLLRTQAGIPYTSIEHHISSLHSNLFSPAKRWMFRLTKTENCCDFFVINIIIIFKNFFSDKISLQSICKSYINR